MSKMSMLSELWEFLRHQKKWWLGPIIAVLPLLILIIVFAESSALAPVIYTFF